MANAHRNTTWSQAHRRVQGALLFPTAVPRRVSMVSVETLEATPYPYPNTYSRPEPNSQLHPSNTVDTNTIPRPIAPCPQLPHHTPQPVTKVPPTPRTYLDRIPIAGLYNFLYADGRKEKLFWAVTLVLSTIVTLLYLVPNIIKYFSFVTVVEVRHSDNPKAPFPVFYAGLNDGLNGTYVYDRIGQVTPQLLLDKRMQRLARHLGMRVQDLIWHDINYNTATPLQDMFWLNTSWVPTLNEATYRVLSAFGSNWTVLKEFYEEGMYKCDQLLRNCRLNSIEFPCCPPGIQGYNGAADVWYKFNISEIFARSPTLPDEIRVTFDSVIDTRFALAQHPEYPNLGLMFGNTLATPFNDIGGLGVPMGTAVYAKVKSRRRVSLYDCLDRYRLEPYKHPHVHPELLEYFKNMTDPTRYSVEKCAFAKMLETMSTTCGCVVHYDTLHPNDTSICTPAHLYICFHGAVESNVKVPVSHGESKDIFVHLKEQASECLPLCDMWDYIVHTTFVPLDGDAGTELPLIRNKVIITVDPDYLLETDVLKIDFVSFLALMGDGLAVFLGMSLLTIIQAVYWVSAAIALHRSRRRISPVQDAR